MIVVNKNDIEFICDQCGRKETVFCTKEEFATEPKLRLTIAKRMMGVNGRDWVMKNGAKQTLCAECRCQKETMADQWG